MDVWETCLVYALRLDCFEVAVSFWLFFMIMRQSNDEILVHNYEIKS